MSRIGKQPIIIPNGVEVTLAEKTVKVKGLKGELEYTLMSEVTIEMLDNVVNVKRKNNTKEARAAHGLTRALINNMVSGVSKGFEKKLEIIGVGYRAQANGSGITLSLGFSHPIEFKAPEGVNIEMDKDNKNTIIISGISKQLVGQAAANIRGFRPPEPYKGKGVRYVNEHVRRKAGKTASKST